MYKAKVDIRSKGWNTRKTKTKQKKQRTKSKAKYLRCWRMKWYKEKRKEEEEVREEVRLYRRKMGDWDASFEMDARLLRRNNTWLTANDEVVWWGTRSYGFDTSMVKDLMTNLITWLIIVLDLIVNDIRRWYNYLDNAVDATICCTRHWYQYSIKSAFYLLWVCSLYILSMYRVHLS